MRYTLGAFSATHADVQERRRVRMRKTLRHGPLVRCARGVRSRAWHARSDDGEPWQPPAQDGSHRAHPLAGDLSRGGEIGRRQALRNKRL